MLRTFRAGDLPAYYDLMTGQFPEEGRYLGWRREEFFRIVRRIDRIQYRLLFGFLNAIGRPLFRIFVLESDGALAGSALESFGEVSAYVASVMVDPRFRRRGFARRLLDACHALARRRRKKFVVLDVIDGNAPALALYESLGYRPVGHGHLYVRPETAVSAPPGASSRVREFRRSDGDPIAAVATSTVSPVRQGVHPVRAKEYSLATPVVRALAAETAAWVVDAGAGPVAWVRASTSPATEAGHLSAPVVGPSADPADVRALLLTAVEWNRSRGATRNVVEVWDENLPAIAALRDVGFEVAYGVQTLAFPTGVP